MFVVSVSKLRDLVYKGLIDEDGEAVDEVITNSFVST